MDINEVTPEAALHQLRQLDASDLLLFAVEQGFFETRLEASDNLHMLYMWLAAHRNNRSFTRVPLVLPVGGVLDIFFAIKSFDTEVCGRIMTIGTGTPFYHICVTEKSRGQFLPFGALAKTVQHLIVALPLQRMLLMPYIIDWSLPSAKIGLFSYTEGDRAIDGRNELRLW
jgi:hypothetical protein